MDLIIGREQKKSKKIKCISRQDLSPWVGGLYVADGFRGKSYGEQKLRLLLQKHVFTEKTTDYKVDNSTFFLL